MTGGVLVFGSVNADDVLRVTRLPVAGETVRATGRLRQVGGKGANQASASAALGVPTALAGSVGDDPTGTWLRSELTVRGIDTTALHTVHGPSGSAQVLVDDQGENIIVVDAGANAATTAAPLPAALERVRPAVLALQLEIPVEVVRAAIYTARPGGQADDTARPGGRADDTARPGGVTIVLNAAPATHLPLPPVDLLVVNETEAETLSGRDDPVAAAALLGQRGARTVIVTLGSRGALVHRADGTWVESPHQNITPAVDTTGAGDVFTGVLCAVLARGAPLADAVRVAVRGATWSVGRAGLAFPGRAEIAEPSS